MSDTWILDAARDFRTGSAMLGTPFEHKVFPLRSAVVTLAFSIELYLKYLAAKTVGQPGRGHDLRQLYGLLPESAHDKINGHYKHSRPISDVLDAHKDAFIDWRYIFEKQHGSFALDFQSLRLIADALEATAAEWK